MKGRETPIKRLTLCSERDRNGWNVYKRLLQVVNVCLKTVSGGDILK